jgi:hypothetical protein
MTDRRSSDLSFRDCALAEATRYGSDPWVFLRELLQNARDAGAGRVEITVAAGADGESITCRDDGCGMSAGHAERYLFSLYASSKEDDERQVGQFGVGFWSVLRFRPRRIVIRSRPRHGGGWQVELERRLESAAFAPCAMEPGTEIVLERLSTDGEASREDLAREVYAAVYRYGRFATRYEKPDWPSLKRRRERPLAITVDGRPVHTEMTLPAPASVFRRRGLRGVVGLGTEPQVELFANGLFVRRATSLDELVDVDPLRGEQGSGDGDEGLDLPASVAPRIVLDSRELEVLLARSDVRQTRHLRRLVLTAERELARLIERQLRALRPPSAFAAVRTRLAELAQRWRAAFRPALPARVLLAALAGGVVAGTVVGWAALGGSGAMAPVASVQGEVALERYADLGARYRGPRLDSMVGQAPRLALIYEPRDRVLFLKALTIDDPANWPEGSAPQLSPWGDYAGTRCRDPQACVTVRLMTESGPLRLPVPTGHRLDPESLRLNGNHHPVVRSLQGEPLLLDAHQGDTVEYQTGPAPEPSPTHGGGLRRDVPLGLEEVADRLRELPLDARVKEAVAAVADRVRYSRTEAAQADYEAARARGLDPLVAALEIGKGDCDVQNGLVVALLRTTGVVARLAVGYVGRNGTVVPGLHAWVEYLDDDRRWRIADASTRSPPAPMPPPAVAAGPPAAGEMAPAVGGIGLFVPVEVPAPPSLGAPAALVALATAVLVLGVWLRHSRPWDGWLDWKRNVPATPPHAETDLAALLGGALRHPGLARLPALLHGRFVPLVRPGGAVSLHQAKRRAAASRLFASAGGGRVAREAAARGRCVIDASTPEGRVTSLGLAATDLDAWERLLESSTRPPLAGRVNRCLEAAGESWRVALAPLDAPAAVVDLARLGLGHRQVLLDPRRAGLAGAALEQPSAEDVFRLLDAAAAHLGLAAADRARVLAEPARQALLERFGR